MDAVQRTILHPFSCVPKNDDGDPRESRNKTESGLDFHRDPHSSVTQAGASTLTRCGRRLIIVWHRKRKKVLAACIPVMADRASSPPYLYHRLIMDHYPVLFVRWLNELASCRIRIRERIHGLFKRRSLSLSLSCSY